MSTRKNIKLNSTADSQVDDDLSLNFQFVKQLSTHQKYYLGGGIVAVIASFFPLVTIASPNFGSLLFGAAANNSGITITLWSLGVISLPVILYFTPLVILGYISYQEIVRKKRVSIFLKMIILLLICLCTASTLLVALNIVLGIQQFILGIAHAFGSQDGGVGSLVNMGGGLILGIVGCGLMIFGLITEIRKKLQDMNERLSKSHAEAQ